MSVPSHPALSTGWPPLGGLEDPDAGWDSQHSWDGQESIPLLRVLKLLAQEKIFCCCRANHPVGLHTLIQDTLSVFNGSYSSRGIKHLLKHTVKSHRSREKLRNQCQSKKNYFSGLENSVVVLLFPSLLWAVCSCASTWPPSGLAGPCAIARTTQPKPTSGSFTSSATGVTSVLHCAFITNYTSPGSLEWSSKVLSGKDHILLKDREHISSEPDLQEPLTGWEEMTSSCTTGGLD